MTGRAKKMQAARVTGEGLAFDDHNMSLVRIGTGEQVVYEKSWTRLRTNGG